MANPITGINKKELVLMLLTKKEKIVFLDGIQYTHTKHAICGLIFYSSLIIADRHRK